MTLCAGDVIRRLTPSRICDVPSPVLTFAMPYPSVPSFVCLRVSFQPWKSRPAAYSTLPPVACNALIAASLEKPSCMSCSIASFGNVWLGGFEGGGAWRIGVCEDEGAGGAGGPPGPPGAETAPDRAPIVVPPGPLIVGSSTMASSDSLGISASPKKGISTPWMMSLSLAKSILAWWRLSISRPRRRSTDLPSITVKLQGKNRLPILIWAECTRPIMFAVPTPRAIPANRLSIRRMMPQASAEAGDMMVACAPESTNAFSLCPLTSTSTYSRCTRPKTIWRVSTSCESAHSMQGGGAHPRGYAP